MTISAKDVKALRDRTGTGMMDCKKALLETNGDLEAAIDLLRSTGAAKAAKRSAKSANEGTIGSYVHFGSKVGVMVELNCETDFVAKTDDFLSLAKDLAMHIAAASPMAVGRDDIPEDDRLALLSALGRAVENGQIAYSPDFREYIIKSQTRPLLSGAVLYDHDWFLENLVSILTKKPGEAATAIWFAAQPLHKSELTKLRDELNEHGQVLGEKTLTRVIRVLDDELKEAVEDAEIPRF